MAFDGWRQSLKRLRSRRILVSATKALPAGGLGPLSWPAQLPPARSRSEAVEFAVVVDSQQRLLLAGSRRQLANLLIITRVDLY